jgi:uncharacterized membrane protein YbjE (DUF340 family)
MIIGRLVDVLKTPSESVQKAVSTCLISLMHNLTDEAEREKLIAALLELLFRGASYAHRRGAAYGLSGGMFHWSLPFSLLCIVVKGIGIVALKKYEIMTKLQQAVENKKSLTARQGALFAVRLHSFHIFGFCLGLVNN